MKIPKMNEMANLLPRTCACQRWIAFAESDSDSAFFNLLGERVRLLRWRGPFGLLDHIVDRRGEFIDARAGHDDRIAAAVGFLGDAEEFAPVVLAELDVKMLTFDLQLPSLYEVIHYFEKTAEFRPVRLQKGSRFLDQKEPSN